MIRSSRRTANPWGSSQGDTIRTMTIADGRSRVIARAPRAESPSWGSGFIVFGEAGDLPTAGIRRVAEDGGPVEVLSTPDGVRARSTCRRRCCRTAWRAAMYHVGRRYRQRRPDEGRVVVQRPGQPARVLLDEARFARYVGDSVIVYQRDRSLFATSLVPSDARRRDPV